MKIAVDVMSGESAPDVLIQGAIKAVSESDVEVIIVGDEAIIQKELEIHPEDIRSRISIKHTNEIVSMNEAPAKACRSKKNASVMIASKLVADKEVDGFFSPGNTGATLAASLLNIKRIDGVLRPAIAIIVPTLKGHTLLLDGGATVDCSAKYLAQFAIMGEIFMRRILEVKEPKIALLSIGEEDHKGNEVSQKAFEICKKIRFNFVGNVEGHDLFEGDVDVIVCDGFIGNIVLKVSEGLSSILMRLIKEEIIKNYAFRLGAFMAKGAFKNVKEKLQPDTYGGAPLLGINGCALVGHGSSGALSTKNAIFTTAKMAKADINTIIKENIDYYMRDIK